MNSYRGLKQPPQGLKPLVGTSSTLVTTLVGKGLDPRSYYLENLTTVSAPLISSSSFINVALINHLMRDKKNSALGVKFQPKNGTDKITNMEGALHTFVTPLVSGLMFGDYKFGPQHGVVRFPDIQEAENSRSAEEKREKDKNERRFVQQARRLVISASIQMDFEGKKVMFALCELGNEAVEGQVLKSDIDILDVKLKQVEKERARYDHLLRAHMIWHLTAAHRLPSLSEINKRAVGTAAARSFLEEQTRAAKPDYKGICDLYLRMPGQAVISLEVLFNSAIEQLRNEISALEAWCPQGYVLTVDPASIFAEEIGATLLNRLVFAALRWLADGESTFTHMRAFAFNDYADRDAFGLLVKALAKQEHVQVLKKASLFPGPKNTYVPPVGAKDAILVIHNNSDGFGQNIETEGESGSLDGAIGANSSAAASLFRTRSDLVGNLM